MGLINLRTNLKDLKFGHDQYGNGSSNEPYIQTRIPATDEPLQTTISLSGDNIVQGLGSIALSAGAGAAIGGVVGQPLIGAIAGLGIGIAGATTVQGLELALKLPTAGTGGPDFLVRGGTLLPNIVLKDAVRLTKFFVDTKGILFTIKQNLLSRAGVRAQGAPFLLNERLYTPISTILGAVGNPFGLHVNKQGLNPFSGFGDAFVPDRYISAIANEINESNQSGGADIASNRLVGLFSVKMLGDSALSPFYRNNSIAEDPYTLLSYGGGPGSILGIGKTNIKYATGNTDQPLSVLDAWRESEDSDINKYVTLGYNQLSDISSNDIGNYIKPKTVDFRTKIKSQLSKYNLSSNAPSYDPGENRTLEQRVNLGDPGNVTGKNLTSYIDGAILGAVSENSYDKINIKSLYQSDTADVEDTNDLVKFRIGVIDNNTPNIKTYIHFRAFLNQISDTYNSTWEPTKYIGRGENFYTYAGFDRKVSLGWTVAAQSKIELIPMYRKLNYLSSIIAPDYSGGGYMRGNIITLTIGGYFYEQPGIVTGFNYEMNDDNDTWEIAIDDKGDSDPSVKELPHLIRVTGFNFIPIHTFVPRLQQNVYQGPNSSLSGYGNEKYISLNDDSLNDNYVAPISTPRFL